MSGNLHEDQHKFFTISRSLFLRMRHVSDRSCSENQNTHFGSITLFEKGFVCEKIWKPFVEPDRLQTIWRMRIACWITKATNTHSE
jgi:hypothetical protein